MRRAAVCLGTLMPDHPFLIDLPSEMFRLTRFAGGWTNCTAGAFRLE